MTEMLQVYKCEICGNIIEMLHAGKGQPVCCGQPMTLLQEKTADAGKEKHVPVVERTPTGVLVRVSSVPHPMEEKHYIEWVEIIGDGMVQRKCLKPGMKPEAAFETKAQNPRARAYCNVHGLWRS